ncbi:MAG TPA: CBS domain-containing protein [Candidatus Margulisiibacteriota bacterium]|nr:CBS domain-containing protein [Candidatus Margulisiibacteriota bacterium]
MSDATLQLNESPLIAETQHSFVFFSTLLDKPVHDANGILVGRLSDLAVSVAYMFPPVVAFVVQRGRWEKFALTGRWSDVADIGGTAIRLTVGIQALTPSKMDNPGEVLIRDVLLDKQIVDMNGAKVVRVNDLHFLKIGACELRLVHVDAGTRGLVRRMGWEPRLDGLLRRVAPQAQYLSAERLIRWNYVQPLSLDDKAQSIRLSVMQRQVKELHPADIAEILQDLDTHGRATMFRSLDPETAADALAEVDDPRIQTQLLETVSQEAAADILDEMPPDEAADLLHELPPETSTALLHKMEAEEALDVRELLTYPPDTAGGMMTTELVALPADLTVEETFGRLRNEAPDVENIYYLFVVDTEHRLVGVLNLRQLILAQPTAHLHAIMIKDPARVHHTDSRDSVAEIVEKYDLLALPVVDDGDVLVGMITVDDVVSHIANQAWKRKLGH